MELPRAPFYDKELELRLSRSYGPGRYDPNYELHGLDYPIGHVRWTEQRNMDAFLGLVADRKVVPSELVTHRFAFGDAERAFELLQSGTRVVGVVLSLRGERRGERPRRAEQPQASAGSAPRRTGRAAAPGHDRGGLVRDRHPDRRAARGRVRARRRSPPPRGSRPRAPAASSGSRTAYARADELIEPRRPGPGRDRDPPRLPRRARRAGARGRQGRVRREAARPRRGRAAARVGRRSAAPERRWSSASTAATRRWRCELRQPVRARG